jgi:uncharacterized membrane protein YfcA
VPDVYATLTIMAVLLFAFSISTATGFGTVVLAIPLCSLVLDVKLVIPLLAVMSTINAVLMVARERREIDWAVFKSILLWLGITFPIGNYAFHKMPVPMLKFLLGVFVTVVAVHGLWSVYRKQPRVRWNRHAGRAILVIGGLVQGAVAAGGPLVVTYAHNEIHDKRAFRATMFLVWVVFNSVFALTYFLSPGHNFAVLKLALCCIPVMPVGMWIGQKLHDSASETFFHVLVFTTLLLSGLSLLFPMHKSGASKMHHSEVPAAFSTPRS